MSTRKVLAFSYLDRYATLVLVIISSMIMARLLSPAEMGVYSVTMVFLSFTGPLKDLGASQYIIREKHLKPEMIRAAWAVQLGLGIILAIFVLGVSNLVADFYREPRIKSIMLVLALTFFLNPFGTLTLAMLSREMRFGSIAIIRFSGTFIGSLISILFAWLGFGPISLAYGALASSLASAFASLWFRPNGLPWIPGFVGIKKIISFGTTVTGISIMNVAYDGTPELILGRLQGMTATGLFGRAKSLVSIFERLVMDGVYAAALPIFSKKIRENESISDVFVKAATLVSGIGWPLLAFLAIFAYPLVTLFYGPKWESAVDITRILCLAMAMIIPALLCGPPLVALGRIKTVFWLTIFNACLQTGLAALGALISLQGLGWAITLSTFSLAILWLYISKSLIGFTWKSFLSNLGKSVVVTVGACVIPVTIVLLFGLKSIHPLSTLVLGGLGALAGYLLTAKAVRHPVWQEIDHIVLRRLGIAA